VKRLRDLARLGSKLVRVIRQSKLDREEIFNTVELDGKKTHSSLASETSRLSVKVRNHIGEKTMA